MISYKMIILLGKIEQDKRDHGSLKTEKGVEEFQVSLRKCPLNKDTELRKS